MRWINHASLTLALAGMLVMTGGCRRAFLRPGPHVKPFHPHPRPGAVVVNPPGPGKVVLAPTRPPAPRVEVRGAAPSPGHLWVGGHWSWSGGRYTWKSGHWAVRPGAGAVWAPGKWVAKGSGWKWVPGHWR